jgi:Domain of unknown function (DUF4333)
MTSPYGQPGGNDPQQWGQQPYSGAPSGGFPQQGAGGYGQQSGGFGDPSQQPQFGGFDPNTGQQQGFGPQQPGAVEANQQPGFGPQPQYGFGPQQGVQGGFQQGFGQPGQGFGQQPQYGFGQQQGQFTGSFGQQGYGLPQPPGQQKKSAAPWIIVGALVAVIAVVLVLGLVWPGWFNKKVFDQAKVQDGVKGILTSEYQIKDVGDVKCPSGQPVKQGTTFSCEVTIGGNTQKVTITVKNDAGLYEVSKPS